MSRKVTSVLAVAMLVGIGLLAAVARSDSDTSVSNGEEIFQRGAGGVGCQYCHAADARGKVGPNIRGKSPEAIKQALGTVLQMSFISLTEEDIEAVAAFLKHLESQP